ncbi:MAG: Gfo/Idh/MocA family oxidoreductase [Pseudonocardia sp.]|nr:Gfo/Idh/MocA family oxidoreductase [Pseudonocardia sp.]
MTEPIGVGIVGLSASRGWAATAHLPALRAQPEAFELRASCGSTPASGAAGATAHGVPTGCADVEELVRRPDVDLVVITVKVPHHEALAGAALEAGKAVLCEWPLGNGTAEAERLAALACAKNVPAFVGLQARAAPPIRMVRELVRSGAIGDVVSTSVLGSGDRWGPTTDDAGVYLLDEANGATLMTIPFGHTIDAVCTSLGEFVDVTATTATRRSTAVHARTGEHVPMTAADQIAVTGVLESGAVAAVHYRGGRSASTNFLWEINGTDGDIVVRGETGHLQYGRVEVLLAEGAGSPLAPRAVPDRLVDVALDAQSPGYTVAQAYAVIARDLRTGTTEAPTFDDAVARHRMLDTIRDAARR